MRLYPVLLAVVISLLFAASASAATFTVNDSDDGGNGVCSDGTCNKFASASSRALSWVCAWISCVRACANWESACEASAPGRSVFSTSTWMERENACIR